MYAATSADYEPRLVRKFSRLRTRTHRSTGCESDQDHDVSQVREDQRQPYFGLTALFDMAQCITWPAADRDRYLGPWDHSGQHPILVVNNRYDPETPLWNAQATTDELGNARLLIVEGYGHTTLNVHSACASAAEANYLITLQLPADGTTCSADRQPFL
jgi:TAP-like protein